MNYNFYTWKESSDAIVPLPHCLLGGHSDGNSGLEIFKQAYSKYFVCKASFGFQNPWEDCHFKAGPGKSKPQPQYVTEHLA